MKNKFLDIIDFEKVNVLLEGFNKVTGFATAILDLEGNILSKSEWRQMCTEFHRINPETSKRCTISDAELAGKLADGEKYNFFKCLNGLIDVALPVVINGEHVANLFSGQFLFEEPDIKFFRKQAEKFGFDEKKYLKALEKVPVVSKEKVQTAMEFLLNMTQIISEMTFQKLELTELNKVVKESEEKFKNIFESANVGKSITLPTGEIQVNNAFSNMLGYNREELRNKKWQEITPEDEIPEIQKKLEPLIGGEKDSARFEKRYIHKNGTFLWADVSVTVRRDENGNPLYFITTIIEITDRKQAEVLLRDEKEQKRIILEFVGNPIFLKDNDHRIIFANRAFFDLFGLDEKNVIGKTLAENVSENERKHFLEIDRNVLDTGIPDYREEEITLEQQINTIITKKTRFIDGSGNKFLVCSIHNITDRKNAEEALKESEEKFKMAFLTSPDSININRLDDGKYVDINDTFTQISGYTREETIGRTSAEISIWTNSEDRTRLVGGLKKFGKVENLEAKFKLKNGRVIDGLMSASVISIGGVPHILSITRDITEYKQTEEQIRNSEVRERQILLDSEKRYRNLFENIAVGFVLFEVVKDKNGEPIDLIIIAANRFFEKTTGLVNKEVEGKLLSKVLPGIENDSANWIGTYGKIAISGESNQFEQGSELLGYYYTVSAFQSEPNRCAVTFLDITEHKQAEAKIKKLNQDLENRVQERTLELSNSQDALLNIVEDLNEKTELLEKSAKLLEAKNKELETFTYSVSHDLKAPLRGIDGYSRLLQEIYSNELNDEAKQFIKTIRESTFQMNQLIEDLLAYSRLERTSIRISKLKIKHLIDSILTLLKNEINANKVNITLEVNDVEITADFDGLSIALRNIVENAIKFSRQLQAPEIKIVLKENVYSWVISVADNGIGFDMKYHNRIFQIFQRLNLPESYKGTGIGLAMVNKSMERMGGKVWAESKPGSGAIFYIKLPKV